MAHSLGCRDAFPGYTLKATLYFGLKNRFRFEELHFDGFVGRNLVAAAAAEQKR